MDELKQPTISQAQFDEVSELAEMAKSCSTLKDAQRYISRIDFAASSMQGRCRYKAADIVSILTEYCKRNADKTFQGMHLANAMSVFESFIEEQETL